jgi:hypothetical protein
MLPSVGDQVIDFFNIIFKRIFSDQFEVQIPDRLRRNAVIRQIEEASDASSQSLTRFFLNQKITPQQVEDIIKGLETPTSNIEFSHINSSYYTPETYVDQLLTGLKCPEAVRQSGHDAIYRIALHSIVQVLMLVGHVMAEWQKLKFATTFELPRRVVNRLNQISEQMNLFASSGQDAVDERFEITYRDYLLQRFHRVEAGTVRMATKEILNYEHQF